MDRPAGGAPRTASAAREGLKHRVLLVSDFFWPGFGGVEIHIYNLAQCLIKRGHKVVVATRGYGNRRGIRYCTNGLKVYYVPFRGIRLPPGTVTMPTFVALQPLLRNICLRERITIVHGHQTTSNLCHEALLHAKVMGIKTVFTDHSLFGFADSASIHINKVLEWTLSDIDHVICVSHTSKQNTMLRGNILPAKVSVIPNATDTAVFSPSPSMKYKTWSVVENITIVVMTRLVYRKGVDLLVEVVPELCKRYPTLQFVIGGDGPRRVQVEQMIELHSLQDRVEMLGEVQHADVKYVLQRGQIFLNCSLTEAFCIAIIEAVACGLLAVSTRVGGVPEVLPSDMLILAEPDSASLLEAACDAVNKVRSVSPWDFHERVSQMYSWEDVVLRTEVVYDELASQACLTATERLERYLRYLGMLYGKLCACIFALAYLLWRYLEWRHPRDEIEEAVDFPYESYAVHKVKLLKQAYEDEL